MYLDIRGRPNVLILLPTRPILGVSMPSNLTSANFKDSIRNSNSKASWKLSRASRERNALWLEVSKFVHKFYVCTSDEIVSATDRIVNKTIIYLTAWLAYFLQLHASLVVTLVDDVMSASRTSQWKVRGTRRSSCSRLKDRSNKLVQGLIRIQQNFLMKELRMHDHSMRGDSAGRKKEWQQ
jgi:hypothetical protein